MNEDEKSRFLEEVLKWITSIKKQLFEQMEDTSPHLVNEVPIAYHLLVYIFTYYKFLDKKQMKLIADASHELRMLPLPYGLLPHEFIEVVDNERLIPGITKIFKLADDFPYVDQHSLQKEKDGLENHLQKAFVFGGSKPCPVFTILKRGPSKQVELLKFIDIHSMRYTFVFDLFGTIFGNWSRGLQVD